MERRQEARLETKIEGSLTRLDTPGFSYPATIEEISGSGARIQIGVELPLACAVKIDFGDSMLLGECVHCAGVGDGRYMAGIQLDQAIRGLRDLRNLMVQLVGLEAVGTAADSSLPPRPSRCRDAVDAPGETGH